MSTRATTRTYFPRMTFHGGTSPQSGLLVRSLLGLLVLGSVGCGDLVGNAALPAGTQSPNTYNTPTGALSMYHGTLSVVQSAMNAYITSSGLLTDELTVAGLGRNAESIGGVGDPTDERMRTEQPTGGDDGVYGPLQRIRAGATQAIGLLKAYAPATSPALQGHMYALAGFAEVALAELYCSGVPLSTIDFQGDFTYKASSNTEEVTRHAQALLDSAIALSSDSARFVWLAQVLKGRALLNRGQYDSAALAVATVPETFRYQLTATMNFALQINGVGQVSGVVVATSEGDNGVPFITANDPRAPVTFQFLNQFDVPLYSPTQYSLPGTTGITSPVVLASGVEARLIEAEAALHRGDASWLTILNTLRTAGQLSLPADTLIDTLGVTGCSASVICGADLGFAGNTLAHGQPPGGFPQPVSGTWSITHADTTVPAPDSPVDIQNYCANNSYYAPCAVGDSMVVLVYTVPARTVWTAGTGRVSGLPALSDPGTSSGDAARVNLLFQERAYWLFLTGHRQGDLRRLVRNYGREQRTVYPVGAYYGGLGRYGSDVNLPIPGDERLNPLFHGCLGRGA